MQDQRVYAYEFLCILSKRPVYVSLQNVQNVYAHASILLLSLKIEQGFYNACDKNPRESLETDIEYFYICDS